MISYSTSSRKRSVVAAPERVGLVSSEGQPPWILSKKQQYGFLFFPPLARRGLTFLSPVIGFSSQQMTCSVYSSCAVLFQEVRGFRKGRTMSVNSLHLNHSPDDFQNPPISPSSAPGLSTSAAGPEANTHTTRRGVWDDDGDDVDWHGSLDGRAVRHIGAGVPQGSALLPENRHHLGRAVHEASGTGKKARAVLQHETQQPTAPPPRFQADAESQVQRGGPRPAEPLRLPVLRVGVLPPARLKGRDGLGGKPGVHELDATLLDEQKARLDEHVRGEGGRVGVPGP